MIKEEKIKVDGGRKLKEECRCNLPVWFGLFIGRFEVHSQLGGTTGEFI